MGSPGLNRNATVFLAYAMRGLAACAIVAASTGCENKPAADTSTVKPDSASTSRGFVRLTPEELSRMQLELAPVVQGQILSHREFPATVQANQNELAEVESAGLSLDVGGGEIHIGKAATEPASLFPSVFFNPG